jgi:putative transposase
MDVVEPEITGNVQRLFRARYKLCTPGLISHITQRAAGREPLFLEKRDYLIMLGLFKESSEKFNLEYYALCLMPNHIHVLLKPREKNLAEAMRSIFSRYAAKFNRRYERRGHLFGGPYRQSVCLDNTYLLTASVYIHLNPVRAGLVEDANQYRWSSSALYCQEKPKESFINPGPILELVDDDLQKARGKYRQIQDKAIGAEPDNALEHEGAVERFCLRLSEIFPSLFKRLGNKKKDEQAESPCLLEVTELERRLKEIDGTRSRTLESRKARKYIVEQLLARGYKKKEIAERMGISLRSVYNIINSEPKN